MTYLSSPLDAAFSSLSKVRLLRLLIEQDRTVSAREASRLTGMSLPAITGALQSLVASGLIDLEVSGRQFMCRANRENLLVSEILAPLFASEAKWPMMLFSEIEHLVESMQQVVGDGPGRHRLDLRAVWIFGSVAKGTDLPGSDLDLMFLAGNDHSSEKVSQVLGFELHKLSQRLGREIRPVIMTLVQARHQLIHRDAFMTSALRNSRVVYGEIPPELELGKTHKRTKSR